LTVFGLKRLTESLLVVECAEGDFAFDALEGLS